MNVRTRLMSGTNWQGPEVARLREHLLADLTADERASLIAALNLGAANNTWNKVSRDSLRETLVELGHTPQEALALVPDRP